MMSHSFEAIQGDNDVEWKFARTKLWLSYIDESSTLPVPFNVLPTFKTVKTLLKCIRSFFKKDDDDLDVENYDFKKRREHVNLPDLASTKLFFPSMKITYSEIIQRLIRRYLFKLERERLEKLELGE